MVDRAGWVPEGVDAGLSGSARVHDHLRRVDLEPVDLGIHRFIPHSDDPRGVFRRTAEPTTPRMAEGLEVLDPGSVMTPEWRPESPDELGDDPNRANLHAVVGRKP
ncbi:hypothetical protein [Umezawaea sp. Da 62-37]|uniref:hypothetical protein n=1 Tax=Umezawaea sp. Da 62-37 TaxID=3075927 RepID=UPI0028F70ED7|nr:hypothetical protein [Umezawaea sp. Da 62-37]WNV89389.1 hypothetical protein RM788_14115 [Umezawaea sp. Da 62-37]